MTHRNARLTPVTRAELVEQVLSGWPQAEVARLFRVSRATVAKWVRRFREGTRSSTLQPSPAQPPPNRSAAGQSALHAVCSPGGRIARLGIAPSTVYAVLRRAGLHRGGHHPGRSLRAGSPRHQETRPHPAGWRKRSCPASRRPTVVLSAAPASVSTSSMWPLRYAYGGPAGRTRPDCCRLPCPPWSARASPSSAS